MIQKGGEKYQLNNPDTMNKFAKRESSLMTLLGEKMQKKTKKNIF